MQLNFGKWEGTELTLAYSFRFTETPVPTQETDCIRSAVNAQHREGYDNISLLSKETYKPGSKAAMHCSFEGLGCPELILVEKPEETNTRQSAISAKLILPSFFLYLP